MAKVNNWARLLAYVTGLLDQELLLQNGYLAAENRILRSHLPVWSNYSNPLKRSGLQILWPCPMRDEDLGRTCKLRHTLTTLTRYQLRSCHADERPTHRSVQVIGSKSILNKLTIRARKDHNAGGRSKWMQGFFDRPSPPLWKAIDG
jgi:hypothetical protein